MVNKCDFLDVVIFVLGFLVLAVPLIEYYLGISHYVFTSALVPASGIPYYSGLSSSDLAMTLMYSVYYFIIQSTMLKIFSVLFILFVPLFRYFDYNAVLVTLYGISILFVALFLIIDVFKLIFYIFVAFFCSSFWFCYCPRVLLTTTASPEFLTLVFCTLASIMLYSVVICIIVAFIQRMPKIKN